MSLLFVEMYLERGRESKALMYIHLVSNSVNKRGISGTPRYGFLGYSLYTAVFQIHDKISQV